MVSRAEYSYRVMDVLGRFAENVKTGDDNYNLYDIPTNTSDQLKKSRINKGNIMNYLAFIFRIFHVFAENRV